MIFAINYSEITLKGKNRRYFENLLLNNIKKKLSLSDIDADVYKRESRIFLETRGKLIDEHEKIEVENKIKNILSKIPGISHFSKIEISKNYEDLKIELVSSLLNNSDFKGASSFRVITKRSNKGFYKTSLEINKEISEMILEKMENLDKKIRVDLKNPDFTVYIYVLKDVFYYSSDRNKGISGLPVGSSGKVLCLFSGGIDSPVAAYLMMKRGCRVDFLHIHALGDFKEVENSKIFELLEILNEYQNESKLYLVDYRDFNQRSLILEEKYDMIVFRRYILRLAEAICKRKNYSAIITGDNLAQVASQTMENLNSVSQGINSLIFRPLIGFNKEEIIDLAKKINTYEESIKEYKDCCSIISKKPVTRSDFKLISDLSNKINIDELISKSLNKIKEYSFH